MDSSLTIGVLHVELDVNVDDGIEIHQIQYPKVLPTLKLEADLQNDQDELDHTGGQSDPFPHLQKVTVHRDGLRGESAIEEASHAGYLHRVEVLLEA